MGAAADRKRRFFEAHPTCCFCGVAAASTLDHVPARVLFVGRQAPDGFEFPACAPCNARERDSEQVVAFHLHAITDSSAAFEAALRGLRNNYPDALPNALLSPGQKAKALSARGITLPAWQIPFAPIVRLSPKSHEHIHRFGRKLAKALFYRVMKRTIPADFRIVTHWTSADQPDAQEAIDSFLQMMPLLEVGTRVNTDLGHQFGYRFSVSIEGDVFVFTAWFSDRLFITGLCGRDGAGLEFDRFVALNSWREAA